MPSLNLALTANNVALLEEVLKGVIIKDHHDSWKALILLEELRHQIKGWKENQEIQSMPAVPDKSPIPAD